MRRSLALLSLAAGIAAAQAPTREGYRRAYQTWREAEPTLEMDAANAGTALAARAQAAGTAATAFYDARGAFYRATVPADSQGMLAGIGQIPATALASEAVLQRALSPATQNVAALVTAFARDADPAIQQLRQALERERAALEALIASIEQRQRATASASSAQDAVGQTAQAALAAQRNAASLRAGLVDQARKEAAAWTAYYERLAQGARGVTVTSTNPASTSTAAPGPGSPPIASPKPLAAKPSIAPLPLARYVGGWVFPPNGVYLGGQPEFVELTVREANGHVTGTMYAKFVLPAASPGDPFVRFDFEGDLQPKRDQQFTLRTSEGAGGTIQLIPGSVFNMIEVVFQTESVANKVRSGNFILIKR